MTDEITVDLEGLSKTMCVSCYNAFLSMAVDVKFERWDRVENGMSGICSDDLELLMRHIHSLLIKSGYLE